MKVNGRDYRTVWIDPADPESVRIIDQRTLPHHFVIESLRNSDDAARAIEEMWVRGAGLIGATAGFGMYLAACEAKKSSDNTHLHRAARKLTDTRPTARNLAWAVERVTAVIEAAPDADSAIVRARAEATRIADEDAEWCRQIGLHGVELIRAVAKKKSPGEPVNLLTHCNAGWLAFVDYGSATAPIYAAHKEGINLHVWVDETRPRNQGASLTAWELAGENVPYTLIPDNTGGHLMQHGMVDIVITGADRVTRNGDAANKIGTYLKALAARDNTIPFYVALPSSTFDWEISDGVREIPIEQRNPDEIRRVYGINSENKPSSVLICLPETPVANYGFDVTPARLISSLITERGICNADESSILSLYPGR